MIPGEQHATATVGLHIGGDVCVSTLIPALGRLGLTLSESGTLVYLGVLPPTTLAYFLRQVGIVAELYQEGDGSLQMRLANNRLS